MQPGYLLLGDDTSGIPRFHRAWPGRVRQLSRQLATNYERALPEAEKLIAEQRSFTEASGDSDGLTRTLNWLSGAIRGRDPARAAQWAEEATNWSPHDPRTWIHRIKALETAGWVPKALGIAWDALERFPENPFVSTCLSHLLIASGRLQEAEQVAADGVEAFPREDGCWVAMAAALRANEKYSQAETIWREILRRFGDDGQSWASLAQVLVLQRKFQQAESELRQGVSKCPDQGFLWNFLGAVLAREGNFPESEKVLQEAVTRFGDRVAKISLAGTIRSQSRLEEALELVEQALKATPAYPYALAEKARILEGMGRFAEASSILENVRHSRPDLGAEEQDLLAGFMKQDADSEQEEPGLLASEFADPFRYTDSGRCGNA